MQPNSSLEPIIFSVVVPCYNRALTIQPTLKSIQDQSFSSFECIVVDDGSADSEALRRVVDTLDDRRFIYMRQENGGGGAARNAGIDVARGKFVAFLDSDDLFMPNKLLVMSQNLPDNPRTALYSQVRVDRGVGKTWIKPDRPIGADEDMGEYLFVHNKVLQTSSIVLSTEVAKEVRFDPSLRKGQDLDFCVRLHASGVRFRMIEQELSIWYDVTEANRTSRVGGYEAPMSWLESIRPLLTANAYSGYRATVLSYYVAGQRPGLALQYLFEGLRAGVPPKIIARQAARCFLPRALYRRLVNAFVSYFGARSVG